MEVQPLKLLFSGDLHIGRASARWPEDLPAERAYAAGAWADMVDLAIEQQVTAVCLSGDVADENNRFFEAIGPLEQGIRRLAERGIRTIAVAGNHDHTVLGRLADQFSPDQFTLLGRGGRWERVTLKADGQSLHIDGWSFPDRHVSRNPLHDYEMEQAEGAGDRTAVLGLIHGDLDNPASPYAPLELARLRSLPFAGWLIGHIHAPRLIAPDDGPFVLYPGSPQALDPGETGLHGPWLAEVSGGSIHPPTQRPRSPIAYIGATVDLTDLADEEAVEQALYAEARDQARQLTGESENLECLVLRLTLTGRTPMAGRLGRLLQRLENELTSTAGLRLVVDRIEDLTLPAIDLDQHATTNTAPGTLARLLKALDEQEAAGAQPSEGEDEAALLQEAREVLEQVCRSPHFAALEPIDMTDHMVRDHLRQQSRQLLAALVSQKQDA